MKIVFLDVDGVLNSYRTCLAYNGYGRNCTPEHIAKLDPVALALIRRVTHAAGADIVLSSTWRTHADRADFGPVTGLNVIDYTKSLCSGIRGEEVQEWLDRHPEVTHYAVIDDSADFLEHQKPHLVRTAFAEGFLFAHADKLAKLLDLSSAWDASQKALDREPL